MTGQTQPARATTDWLAVAVLFAAGLAAAMHFAKAAPVMDAIGRELHMSLIVQGLAVSILGLVGVVFAIATGAVAAAIGLARGLIIALAGGAALAAATAAAPEALSFLVLRFMEGFSHLLIVVCAPGLMAAHAVARDRPIVMALWGCFFGVGFALLSVAAPPLVAVFGWRGLFASHAVMLAAVALAAAWVLRRSGHRDVAAPFPGIAALITAHIAVYRSGAPLLLALTFCAYTIQYLAVLTFLGRYLVEARGWMAADAGAYIGAMSMLTIGATLCAGFLVRHGAPLFTGLALAFAVTAVTAAGIFGFDMPNAALLMLVAVMMAGFGLMPGFVFANVPAVAPTSALAALTLGAIAQFGNVGTFSGTPVFALGYQLGGWPGGALFLTAASLAGIALAWQLRRALSPTPEPLDTQLAQKRLGLLDP